MSDRLTLQMICREAVHLISHLFPETPINSSVSILLYDQQLQMSLAEFSSTILFRAIELMQTNRIHRVMPRECIEESLGDVIVKARFFRVDDGLILTLARG